MRTRIKFCGFVRPEDVDAAVALGVDAIGFVFYPPSPRFIDADEAAALRARLPAQVQAVGLFVNAGPARVCEVCARTGLDIVQFHGDESPSECADSVPPGVAWWRAVRMRGPGDLLESKTRFPGAQAFLLDSFSDGYGGSGEGFDWSWARGHEGIRIVMSGGLSPENVGQVIEQVSPFAVDVSSGIQEGDDPRRKSPQRMARFVEQVRASDARRTSASLNS